MIAVERASPHTPEAAEILAELSNTLTQITGSSGRASFDPADIDQERALFVLARDDSGQPVGCGALRPLETGIAEIKRMFAVPGSKGVGSAILGHLETAAKTLGYAEIWLETRQVNSRAIDFYRRHGYARIANFGQYADRPEAVCLAKTLIQ